MKHIPLIAITVAVVSILPYLGIPRSASGAQFVVTTTADSGAGSLRQAINDANNTAGLDSISFAIPGAGPHTISPTMGLPDITEPVRIDGYTQPGATGTVRLINLDGAILTFLTVSTGSVVRGLVI